MSNFTQSDAKVRIYLDMATFYLNNLLFFDKIQEKNSIKIAESASFVAHR